MNDFTEDCDPLISSADESPAAVLAQVDSLNEQSWDLKEADARQALELATQARQLAESHSYERGIAYSLRNRSCCHYLIGDYQIGLADALGAISLFEKLADKHGIDSALNRLGSIYNALGEFSKAIECLNRSLEICEEIGDREEAAASLNNLGVTYFYLCDYAKALDYWQQSLQAKEDLNIGTLSKTLCNIGSVYDKLGEPTKAINTYHRALEISRKVENPDIESVCLMNLGQAYVSLKDHANGLDYLLKASEVSRKNGNKFPEASIRLFLGNLYRTLGDYDDAMRSYAQALEIIQQIGHRTLESQVSIEVGKLFYERAEYSQAVATLLKALGIAEEIGNNEFAFEAHLFLSQAYEAQEHFAQALDHQKAFFTFRQKVFGEEADKKLKRVMIHAEVEQAQREAEIYRLKHVELAARVKELEEALAQIKELQLLLPICSYCKSIRNDGNYWQDVETYISQNTGSKFSHGICPACYEKEVLPQLEEMRRQPR